MKGNYLFILLFLSIMISCSKDNEVSEIEDTNAMTNTKNIGKSLSIQNDSIIPLNEKDFPKKEPEMTIMDAQTDDAIYQLQGVEFYLQSTNFNFGENFLETMGPGQELSLANYQNDKTSQLFYLQFFSAATGIKYMIYSVHEDLPVSVGSYSSTPDDYVVYLLNNDSYSYGASWDFIRSNTLDGGFTIENTDLLGGSGWNFSNYAMDTSNGNLSMQLSNGNSDQEFEIVPNYQFEILSIDFEFNQAEILSSQPINISQVEFVNDGNTTVDRTNILTETYEEDTSFEEQKGISLNQTSGFDISVGMPEAVNVGASYEVQQGSTQTVTYGENSTVTRSLSDHTTFTMEPYTRTLLTYTAFKQILSVEYVATCRAINTNLEIEIRGVWEGVDYSYLQITKEDFDLNTNALMHTEQIEVIDQ